MAEIPRNWLTSTRTFAEPFSDARGEGIAVFTSSGQEVYTSKSRSLTPIRVLINSPSVSFWLQKCFLTYVVTLDDSTGNPLSSGPANCALGGESVWESVRATVGGTEVERIPDHLSYAALAYKDFNNNEKQFLQNCSGYGQTDVFANTGSVKFAWRPYLGCFNPSNGGPMHIWLAQNQAMELELRLADPRNVFTAGNVAEYRISNIKCFVPYTTPPPQFITTMTNALAHGEAVHYDYRRPTFTTNACSGGQRNTFIIHQSGVRSLANYQWYYLDDAVLADQSKDKSLNFSDQNLKSWRLELSPNNFIPNGEPFHHDTNDPETLLISNLTNNSFEQLGELSINFADYAKKMFSWSWSFQSNSEADIASLSFAGTDGIFRIHTFNDPPPPQSVRLVTVYRENVTIQFTDQVNVI
ncbi:hypothetical protein HDU86_002353 [Geranomyces michiganensis]|nr:hypothetical protein HDU86_002353 [Geranomyces michiganensis]